MQLLFAVFNDRFADPAHLESDTLANIQIGR
jgi:hypothetical protein